MHRHAPKLRDAFADRIWEAYKSRFGALEYQLWQRAPLSVPLLRHLPQDATPLVAHGAKSNRAYIVGLILASPPSASLGTLSLVNRYDKKGEVPSGDIQLQSPWSKTGPLPAHDQLIWSIHRGASAMMIENPDPSLYTVGAVVGAVVQVVRNGHACVIESLHFPGPLVAPVDVFPVPANIAAVAATDFELIIAHTLSACPLPSSIIHPGKRSIVVAHGICPASAFDPVAFGQMVGRCTSRLEHLDAEVLLSFGAPDVGAPTLPYLPPHKVHVSPEMRRNPRLHLLPHPCTFDVCSQTSALLVLLDQTIVDACATWLPDKAQAVPMLLALSHLAPVCPALIPCSAPTGTDALAIPLAYATAIVCIFGAPKAGLQYYWSPNDRSGIRIAVLSIPARSFTRLACSPSLGTCTIVEHAMS